MRWVFRENVLPILFLLDIFWKIFFHSHHILSRSFILHLSSPFLSSSLLESQSREENIMKITARKRMLEVAGRRLERKNVRKEEWYNNVEAGAGGNTALARVLVPVEKKGEGRSSVDRESNNQQLIQLEEKDVVTSVATVLSDLCGLREWMAMEKLHTE
ncbi:hypothetical protein ES288_A04G107000v1 [Gossypium darwinii]|uniref:Uncharacterized protein n=1 Tax=Gossypium darwinii TaxID=34276 RepID=A0A5D2GY18_GOSDA|nr:hypothetical protein ES288_A04G107000v1 [Gossypium darwinii]